MSEKDSTKQEWHKKQAIHTFNSTWDLIEKKNRSLEDNLRMIHMAHASRYHWGEIGTELEFARGEWQISRVYSIVNCPERALFHANMSLNYCISANIHDFDRAFAYEAIARSYYLLDQLEDYKTNYNLALVEADTIKELEDKTYFLKELNSIVLN